MYNKAAASVRGGMSFILAQTLLHQLSTLDSPLIARINHVSLIYSEVKAILDAKKEKLPVKDAELLQTVEKNIEVMRTYYEPFLDQPESLEVGSEKRKSSEKLLDISRYNLLYIIELYKLVDVRTLQDVTGVTWGAE